jgi:hypothetical protein
MDRLNPEIPDDMPFFRIEDSNRLAPLAEHHATNARRGIEKDA